MNARRQDDPRARSHHTQVGLRELGLLSLVAITNLVPNCAEGAVTPITYNRQVSTFAFLDTNNSPDALRSDELIESLTDGAFTELAICQLTSLGSQVTATSEQVSEITLDRVMGSFQSNVGVTVSSQQHSGLGIASGGITYEFSVDAATQLRMTGTVDAAGGASFDLSVFSSTQGFLLQRQWASTDESYEELLQLSPGNYRLAVGGGGDGTFGPQGGSFSDLMATIDAQFLLAADVPASVRATPSIVIAPNPIQDGTEISFRGPLSAGTRVAIFDPSGREVRSMDLPAGAGAETGDGARWKWDGRDRWNRAVPAGIYLIRVEGGASTRAVVLR